MKYKVIAFDMDGTVLDTLDDLTATTNYVLGKHGYPLKSREEVRKNIGDGIIRLIDRSADDLTEAELEAFVHDFIRTTKTIQTMRLSRMKASLMN